MTVEAAKTPAGDEIHGIVRFAGSDQLILGGWHFDFARNGDCGTGGGLTEQSLNNGDLEIAHAGGSTDSRLGADRRVRYRLDHQFGAAREPVFKEERQGRFPTLDRKLILEVVANLDPVFWNNRAVSVSSVWARAVPKGMVASTTETEAKQQSDLEKAVIQSPRVSEGSNRAS